MANFYGTGEYDSSVGSIYNPAGTFLDQTTSVGSYAHNAWGLYDMHGNVREWCSDWWSLNLPGGSVTNPVGPNTGSYRVVRGGSWIYNAKNCRTARRDDGSPYARSGNRGFRVVLGAGQP
jgi:formylglycine-generating enzyme required for sulfatase activity